MTRRPAWAEDRKRGLHKRIEDFFQRTWSDRSGLSVALLPLSWAFAAIVASRRLLYRKGVLATRALPVPVVVVGNILAGGAGKTPATIAIVELLRGHGWTPGVVSRGYGRIGDAVAQATAASAALQVGDEPILIARRTQVPVFVGSDRVAAGHALLQAHPDVDIVVSDDGLQHLALGRAVEVVVFDDRGAANRRLLPAGPLREPMPRPAGLRGPASSPAGRARRLVLYNAAEATTPLPGYIAHRRLSGVVSLEAWARGEPPSWEALAALRGRSIVAAAGLARPNRFFDALRQGGLQPRELPLADHHDFAALPWPCGTGDVVVTEKDAVKLAGRPMGGARVWVAGLDFEPEAAFAAALLAALARRRRGRQRPLRRSRQRQPRRAGRFGHPDRRHRRRHLLRRWCRRCRRRGFRAGCRSRLQPGRLHARGERRESGAAGAGDARHRERPSPIRSRRPGSMRLSPTSCSTEVAAPTR